MTRTRCSPRRERTATLPCWPSSAGTRPCMCAGRIPAPNDWSMLVVEASLDVFPGYNTLHQYGTRNLRMMASQTYAKVVFANILRKEVRDFRHRMNLITSSESVRNGQERCLIYANTTSPSSPAGAFKLVFCVHRALCPQVFVTVRCPQSLKPSSSGS